MQINPCLKMSYEEFVWVREMSDNQHRDGELLGRERKKQQSQSHSYTHTPMLTYTTLNTPVSI